MDNKGVNTIDDMDVSLDKNKCLTDKKMSKKFVQESICRLFYWTKV